ncbi:MAG: sortase [Clostridia bacterium]|nr:sortase [Clostridia bacterium]
MNGNICLAGHNNTANYESGNFYFDRIDELEIGDKIYYRINNQDFKFQVKEMKEVNEKDLSILDNTDTTELTLITCIQGKHSSRLIVIAEQTL